MTNLGPGLVKAALILVTFATVGYYLHNRFLLPPLVMDGSSSHDFKSVAREFKRLVETRAELGGAFAVYYKGQSVLEMIAGYKDLEYTVPWSHNTLAYGMSIAKAAGALCIAQLVDRGFASYSDPVAKHWPEFAANGKQDITLRQLLSHQAGLFGLDRIIKLSELAENDPVVAETLAKQSPLVPIGTVVYHGLTFGLYVDQLVRRLDPKQRSVDQYFHEEIVKHAKVETYIGISRYQFYRLARVHFHMVWNLLVQLVTLDFQGMGTYLRPGLTRIGRQASFEVLDTDNYLMRLNDPEVAVLPFASVNLVTNAPSLARLFSLFANNGSVDSSRIIRSETIADIANLALAASTDSDPVSGLPVTSNVGFTLLESPMGSTMIGHMGFGGQMVWSDPQHSVTIAYLTNHLRPCSPLRDRIHRTLIDAVYEVVAKLEAKKSKK